MARSEDNKLVLLERFMREAGRDHFVTAANVFLMESGLGLGSGLVVLDPDTAETRSIATR